MITADKARTIAEAANFGDSRRQLKNVQAGIKDEARRGYTSYYTNARLHADNVTKLQRAGFTVRLMPAGTTVTW